MAEHPRSRDLAGGLGVRACTIVACNYLAHARAWCESFLRWNPGVEATVLVLDLPAGQAPPPIAGASVVGPADIGLGSDLGHLATMYDVTELATAVKPTLLGWLLREQGDVAVYFDPDIVVFDRLDDIWQLARSHGIVLTPHLLTPLAAKEREPLETTVLLSGMFNLGFLAVGQEATAFLDWWGARLADDCLIAHERGRFVDQRWVDFVPVLFDHTILRDPGCNVAWWNLAGRTVSWQGGDRYEVGGVPLRFFHFSGFDPRQRPLLSRHLGDKPSLRLSDQPDLRQLCEHYARMLERHGFARAAATPYGFGTLVDGTPLDRRMRRLYRESLRTTDETATPAPNAFDEPRTTFLSWLCEPADPCGGAETISRYILDIWRSRADLQGAFPNLRWANAPRFLEWVRSTGVHEERIPAALLPDEAAPARAAQAASARSARVPGGVNVAGYLRAELGIGQAARQVVATLDEAGIAYSTMVYSATSSRQQHPFRDRGTLEFDTNIICVNADRLLAFRHDVGPGFFEGRRSIGLWFWEIEAFPESMRPAFAVVDEVWVASEFCRETLERASDGTPVRVFPLPVDPRDPDPEAKSRLGLAEGFTFLFMFDFFSIVERKNPFGLVEAFARAFAPGEGAKLIIKSINGDRRIAALEQLKLGVRHPDITVLDGYLDEDQLTALTAACDCYVSLHRSEGFGLTMAEAMAMGKPVIATGYSGNLTFMDQANSYLVRHELVEIPPGCEPYPTGAVWAEPDLDHAADLMRRVFDDPAAARRRGALGRAQIAGRHSLTRAAAFLAERLADRNGGRPSPAGVASVPALGPLDRAHRYLDSGPTLSWTGPSRFGATGKAVRRMLQRALRPHLVRQRELDLAVVEGLTSAAHGLEALTGEVATMHRRLEAELAAWRSSDEGAAAWREMVDRHLSALSERLAASDRALADGLRQVGELAEQGGRERDALLQAQATLSERLQLGERRLEQTAGALTADRDALTAALARLQSELTDLAELGGRERDALVQAQAALSERLQLGERRLEQTAGALTADRDGLTAALARQQSELTEQLLTDRRRVDHLVEEHAARGQEFVAAFERLQSDLVERLEAVELARANLEAHVVSHMDATPYVANPEHFLTTDREGRPALGLSRPNGRPGSDGGYRSFQDVFRGPEDFIRGRQRRYLDVVSGHQPVLDLGCGRGEFLDVMAEHQVSARGVDIDPGMVERCLQKGHQVAQADALAYLAGLPDGQLGAIFCAEVIEHLGEREIRRLLDLAARKLRAGGILVAETVNPECMRALKTFWVDPTHRTPLFPEVAVSLCLDHGFSEATVLYPNGTGTLELDRCEQGEYAVIATAAETGEG